MMRSLFSGVSGLKGHQTRMDVIGNNIANVNTTGFKGGRVTFQDMLSQTLSGAAAPQGNLGGINPQQIGLGVGVASIDTLFTDGSVQGTGKNTDLAISGDGFFIVSDGAKQYYTRNGGFEFDTAGNLVLPGSGMHVQGWTGTDGVVNTGDAIGDIVVQKGQTMPSKASTSAAGTGNLSASANVPTTVNKDKTTAPGEDMPIAGGITTSASGVVTTVRGQSFFTLEVTNAPGMTVGAKIYDAAGQHIGSVLTAPTAPDDTITIKLDKMAYYEDEIPDALYTNTVAPPASPTLLPGTINRTPLSREASKSYVLSATIPAAANVEVGTELYDTTLTPPKLIGKVTHVTKGATTTDPDTILFQTVGIDENWKNNILAAASVKTLAGTALASLDAANPKKELSAGVNFDGAYYTMSVVLPTGVTMPEAGDIVYDAAHNELGTVVKTGTNSFEILTKNALMEAPAAVYYKDDHSEYQLYGAVSPSNTTPAKEVYSYSAEVYTPGAQEQISFQAYDSQGVAHKVTGTLEKVATNHWTFTPKALADTGAVVTGAPIDITFDANGHCLTGSGALMVTPVDPPLGANSLNLTMDFTSMTQYSGASGATAKADGNADGTLESVAFDTSGMLVGTFSNGLNQNLAKVALGVFSNPGGLTKEGTSFYVESVNSGTARVTSAGNGGTKTLSTSSVEMSNVNLSDQFSDMIVTQRGFQSNSKIITVSDEMLDTLINMKR